MGVGNVWGATITTGTPATTSEEDLVINDNKFTINGAKFKELISAYPKYIRFTAFNSLNEKVAITNVVSDYRTYKSFGADGYVYGGDYQGALWSDDGVITVTLPDGVAKLEIYTKDQYVDTSGDNITEPNDGALVTYTLPVADSFESSLKEGGKKEFNIKEHDGAETSSATVDFSKTLSALGGTPKYVRFILKKNGAVVDPTGILTITDVTPAAQTTAKPKQGFYLYNSGNALSTSGMTVTLNAADYTDYQVVCMLSTDEATSTGNEVTTEPEWDLEYTYTFEKVETLPFANLGDAYLQLNKHSEVLSFFGKTEDEMKDSWYGRWSIRNKDTGTTQPLAIGASQADAVWSVYASVNSSYEDGGYLGDAISGNYVVNNSGTELLYGATSADRAHRSIGYLQVYAPTEFATMQGASDYEIVYEVTDEYTSGTPEFKLRYVFKIPAFENEPNAGMTEADKPQTISDRSVASFTLGDMPTDAKYARFYLMDKDDNIIAPSTILSVTSGTACGKAESGIYLYNSGSVLTPTVTIAASNAYKLYKVVGLFSTALDDINASGTTVNHEPKWDMKYTYTFDYTITTNNQEPKIEWDATAMETDATDTDIDANWNTSLAELAAGQTIKWWVKDGSDAVQPLAIGTSRQDGTWTIGLPTGFAVTSNVATLSGMTSVDAGQLESWVKTNVYAPSDKTYADVHDYKIVCEVYTNNAGTGNPNARYTFSIHKGFVGSLKSTATDATERVLLAASDVSKEISVTLPTGTKYLRAYLTNANGTAVTPTGLTLTDGKNILPTVVGYDATLGTYLYNSTGLTSPATVTLTLSDATLDQYHVVVVTSKDDAVVDGSDNVTSEPDWDSKTTYWFKYPAKKSTSLEENVEWSAQSMQITAPAIESTDNLGAGYLENNKKHYTLQWSVVDKDGNAQPLYLGSSRVNDYWSVAISGSPFTLSADNKVLAVTNDANLSTSTWTSWTAPVFYAPANKTMKQITDDGIVFVCKFYEDDNAAALNDALLSMTYTVYIDRTKQLGKLKDGGKRGGETITTITSGQTEATISLKDASDAFLSEMTTAPTYARIYLTKSDGTLIDPTDGTEKLTNISGANPFTTPTYGYYLQDESGLTLPDATLTLPANKFNYYYVVVAMSKDTGETGHTGAFARELTNRGASIDSVYEPDYDYIYTIKFKETSTFPGTVTSTAFTHSNEVLVASESVTSAALNLAERESKILTEFEKASFNTLASNFHIRWYITKKNDDGDFEKIPNSEAYLEPKTGQGHQTEENQGLYWNSTTKTIGWIPTDAKDILNVTFNRNPGGSVPELTGDWEDYKVYVVLTTDLTGQTDDGGTPKKLTHEPDNLTMVHTYSFFTESTFQFVHDKGASERPYITPSTDAELHATVQQYTWDNSVSTIQPATGDIRQGVHTVEYDVYVDPTSSTPVILQLPFQNYTGTGDALEPTAYIRWYDWNTDVNNSRLTIVGTALQDKTESNQGATVSRGFFMLNNDEKGVKPIQSLVGVTFNPLGLTDLTSIACDVSKFYDGIYTGTSGEYLMHEPTLSTRYIFRVRPASVIATSIQIGKTKFDAAGSNMFQLAEDNGRVSVAIKDASTKFSVRAQLPMLGYYYINNGGSQLNCNKITWWAYYEDETGVYRKDDMESGYKEQTKRIVEISVGDLTGGYTAVSGGAAKSVTASKGRRFHIVGYVGNGTNMAPAIHYEMILVDAPAYQISELPLERTEAYLREHMTLQATVDFDNLGGLTLSDDLTSQLQNHSTEPLPWDEAQYGFCYPDVRRIHTSNDDLMGISPLHGDYMLLKSMNKAGVSADGQGTYYKYHWWQSGELLDYTYYNGMTDKGKYGSFLYVDASDESRTIAQMKFNANLCVGSELCFTGYIADMTSGTEYPQMMATVYGVKSNGDRVRVVSFHSSNLSTATTAATIGDYKKATWHQMYGRVAIPSTVDLTGVVSYVVDIDNYATQTDGADYAVDQLQFYTSNAKLKVKQQDVSCGDDKVKINIYVDAEAIQSKAGSNIFWRICDENGNPMSAAMKLYDDAGTLTYGTTAVPMTVPTTIDPEATFNTTTPNSGYFIGTDGNTYFSLASKYFALEQGKQYYVSVYSLAESTVSDEALWGKNTDACDIYSPIFVPKMMYLEMRDGENNVVTSVDGDCSTGAANVNLKVVLNMPDADEISGFKEYDAVPFDFFLGDKSTYTTYEKSSVLLSNALEDFRTSYPFATTIPTEYSTAKADNAAVIKQAVDAGLLFLDASPTFNHSISSANNTLLALPVVKVVNNGTSDFHICSPLEYVFTINTTGNGPTLTLGFEDVTGYPDAIRVVRVGLEQLKNMQDGSFILHIPVHNFKRNNSADDKNGTLTITGDLDLLKYQGGTDQTTDSKVSADVDKVATFEGTTINSSNMYIAVNFHGTGVTKPTFYEGFAYRMFFQVRDASDVSACEGNVEFLLKVVPEFVTWQGGSAAWNSDANWKRSERAELYKGEVTDAATANNQATAGHPNGYKNNSEISVSTTPSTFVPMKFTYVTIPSDLRAPNLVNLAYDGTTKVYGNMETGATDNIQYDLMVRYTEETCQDHGGSGAVYDCEKFYGNWAKELYMKPSAELLNQQYLTYEKVWVEKELDANTWTLMSTPLQNTYAGDMYVPYNSTDANKNGRQISEAFQPITFSTTANAAGFTYSRTKYPIYQKGWTQQGVYVYTKTNDIRKTKYSANIPGGVVNYLTQWSHEYNDVTVPYSIWTAFAIRPHKKDQTAKTLIRLPKADTSFDYYQWDNTSPDDGKLSQTISKETTGKLLTDGTANISGVTYGTVYGTTERHSGTGEFNALVERVQSSPANYQLVGNPYLCSINMATFISENAENLDGAAQGYWTYDNNQTSSAFSNGYIAPMQSFFVKVKDGATGVVFKPSMMVDGHTVVSAPAREFTLMATNERGASAATVSVGEETKSVETLFDSNLADVPVVYTVAEGRAVSINKVEELTKPIAFGVNCNSNDMVEVTFSDIERLTDGEVFVVDAVDGKTQQIYEGDTFTVQPNDYGRYFLTFGGVTSIETTLPTQDGTEGEKVIFDLQGRRVIYPGKGVYIVNGKKVVYK
ncbi:MAG: hypothetical protein IJ552_02560 [Prevotella sp.]|nr:hypothetical protein [Prevotella sp.]